MNKKNDKIPLLYEKMKHGFLSLKQILSHITKFPRGFFIERDFSVHRDLSSGIFPFTKIFSLLSRVFSFPLI